MILKDEAGERVLHPTGQWVGVCVDVVDVGMVETTFGPKYKVRLVFETDAEVEKTDRHTGEVVAVPGIVSRSFTATLNEKGNLRPFLEAWLGRKMKPQEVRGFDAESLLGVGALVTVVHETGAQDGKQYDKLLSVAHLPKQMQTPVASGNYTRMKDRPPRDEAAPGRPAPGRPAPGRPGPRPAPAPARRPEPASPTRSLQQARQPVPDVEDVPTALQDDDDDLPF